MERFRNYGLWIALAALGGMIANDAFNIASSDWERYVDAILGLLIAAGVINNPSLGTGFKDDN